MKKKIRLLIVDDHFIVRIGLASTLNGQADMLCVADTASGAKAIELYRQHRPDIVLMDLRLPDMNGIEATLRLRNEFSNAAVIMISTFDGEDDIYSALQAGASSFLPKDTSLEEMLQTIRATYGGRPCLPPSIAARLANRIHRRELSNRESEVLQLVAKGLTNKQIASTLGIAEMTVKLHVSSILVKLNAQDRTHATTLAIQHGIVHLK